MKIVKIIAIILLVAFIVIQFIPSKLNESDAKSEARLTSLYEVPQEVEKVLATSCYDCHSNNTEYPWYNKIQPVAMYLSSHVEDGKRHLNFSEFGNYSLKKQKKKLKEVSHEVEDGEMPLSSYTLIHWDAGLSEADKELLIDWADNLNSSL